MQHLLKKSNMKNNDLLSAYLVLYPFRIGLSKIKQILMVILVVFLPLTIVKAGDTKNPVEISQQQKKQISGLIRDVNNVPIIGANIIEKNAPGNGTVTDVDGRFTLSIGENVTILVSYIGYLPQEISVAGKTYFEVILQEDRKTLDEVVVVGYGTQRKVNLTGSVDQIGGKSIENVSVSNISRALQGQIPGLNINFNNGRPTSNPAYNIRGLTSIGAGGSALILIDGIEGDPSTINAKDIESVSVLKDAASAAIYGARGAFGVVLITTKTPTREPQLSYTGVVSVNNRTTKRDVVTDSYIWAKMYNEGYQALYGFTRKPTSIGSSGILFSDDYIEELKYRSENPNHGLPEVAIDPVTGKYLYYGNTDWWNELYTQNIPSSEHNLSVSGGGDKYLYSLSGRFFTQDGLYKIRSDKFNTYDLRSKGSATPFEWLTINSNIHYSTYNYKDPFRGADIWRTMQITGQGTPMAVIYNPDGTFTEASASTIGVLYSDNQSNYKQTELLTNIGFNASIIKNTLDLIGDFSYKRRENETFSKYLPVPYSTRPNELIYPSEKSSLSKSNSNIDYFSYNLHADFNKRWNNHTFNLIAGTNIETSNIRHQSVSRDGLLIKELSDFNLTTGENFTISGGGNDWANAGIFLRLNYNFKEKYLFEMNSRYDGSSKFPKSKQFSYFPSFSAGWRLSEEEFLSQTRDWLDNLKFRASYGSLGSSVIAPYLFVEQISARQTSRVIQGEKPVVISNPAVLPDNFTWETSTTFNAGFDVDLLQNRFGLVFDWYKRNTTDMITTGPIIPNVFGASIPRGNYADLSTKGFELSIKWNDRIELQKPLNYGIRFTLADNISIITKYNNPQGNIIVDPDARTAGYYEGMRIGDLWGFVTEGLFVDEEDIKNHADQSSIQPNVAGMPWLPGDIKFKDLNNDGKIDKGKRTLDDHGDWKIIGNTTSRYIYGVTLNSEYSNFSFSAFFQGVAKKDWYPVSHQSPFLGQYGVWYADIPKHTLENGYTLDNPDPNAYWPLYKGNLFYGERMNQTQTRFLQNAAYIRLKDLTISYSLNNELVEKLKAKSIKISLSGQNIWTYSPIFKITKDMDPEQLDGGWGTYYPMLKTYSVGINLIF